MIFRRVLSAILCAVMLLVAAVPMAAAPLSSITVDPINIEVGGKVFLPTDVNGKNVSVFVYQGTTYAPLRALAEAYGLRVGYDHAKKLATVDFTAASVLTEEIDRQLRSDLQKRIDEILATETEIVRSDVFIPGETYTGTAYYVSNDGDDNNDGLTPETAWQSVGKLLQELNQREDCAMKPGDAIFLRRGDIFRLPWCLSVSLDNVTISAYGEGEKPILTASSENGSGEEKWELVYEDGTGKKIWKFYRDMRDTSMVVLNNGEAITRRVIEFYTEDGYISCTDSNDWSMHMDTSNPETGVTLLGKLLPLQDAMTEDLNLISRPVRSDPDSNYGESGVGPLYLRCDKGNPGQIYSSIEFAEMDITSIIWLGASDVVFDNLSFRCNGNSWIKAQFGLPWWDIENTLIQNCEFAYDGGSVTQYNTTPEGTRFVAAQGDGIYGVVKNTTIRNNYFHDTMSNTVGFEWPMDDPNTSGGYWHILDNVMVNTLSLHPDSTAYSLQNLDSFIIRGNQIWNTGRYEVGKSFYAEGTVMSYPNRYGECIIEENVLYGTENGYESNALLNVWFYTDDGDTVPVIRNNTYVQYADRKFGYFSMCEERNVYMDDPELLIKAAEMIGDTTSKFYVIR